MCRKREVRWFPVLSFVIIAARYRTPQKKRLEASAAIQNGRKSAKGKQGNVHLHSGSSGRATGFER
jgi:hypothetical protein